MSITSSPPHTVSLLLLLNLDSLLSLVAAKGSQNQNAEPPRPWQVLSVAAADCKAAARLLRYPG